MIQLNMSLFYAFSSSSDWLGLRRIYQNYRSPGKLSHNLRRICEDMRTHQNSSDTPQDRLP